jgi:lipopolysaccharide cholinephosphotransferase
MGKYLNNEDLEEIPVETVKKLLLEELSAFHDFCERNNLRYYLSGGTLLGAIRHGGFIPWDDDIDLIMPRPDYDRLIDISKNGINDAYSVQSFHTDKKYIYPFAKLCDIRTNLIETRHRHSEGSGIFIDIFPMDGISSNDQDFNRQLRGISRLRRLGKYAGTSVYTSKNVLLTIPRLLVILVCKCVGSYRINRAIENMAAGRDFNAETNAAVVVWGYKRKEKIRREVFLPRIKVSFEGKEFWTTGGYHEYLSNLYGDYMKLPPIQEQTRQHDYQVYWKKTITEQ